MNRLSRVTRLRIWLSRIRLTPVRTEHINETATSLPTHFDAIAHRLSSESGSLRVALDNVAVDTLNNVLLLGNASPVFAGSIVELRFTALLP